MGRSLERCSSFQPSLSTLPSVLLLPGTRRSWKWSVSLPHSSPSASLSPHSSSSSSSFLPSDGDDHHHYLVGKVCVEMAMPGASFWLDRHCLAQLFYHWTHSTHANTLNTRKHKSLSLYLWPSYRLFYSTYSRKWHDIKSASAGPLLLNDVHIVQLSLNISEGARSDYFVFSPRAVLLVTRVIICNSNSDRAVPANYITISAHLVQLGRIYGQLHTTPN